MFEEEFECNLACDAGAGMTIDISAVQHNYLSMKKMLGRDVVVSAVLKSDAYGLGAQKIAAGLRSVGCHHFWVAYIQEAIEIRAVLTKDIEIYFLQGVQKSDIALMKKHKIIPVVNSLCEMQALKGQGVPMVLNVDTGFSRLGIRECEMPEVVEIAMHENVKYVMSHLSCSDDKNSCFNQYEKEKFDVLLSMFKQKMKAGISASGGALLDKSFHYDIVRIGAFLYGIEQNGEVDNGKMAIHSKNVLSIQTVVLQKYEIAPETKVGYGVTFVAPKKMKIAVLSIGYADGLKRCLSGRGAVFFYDGSHQTAHRADIVGNISMDSMTVDVSDIPDDLTNVGSVAYILDKRYTINNMAQDANTIAYEVLTGFKAKSTRFEIKYI